MEKNWYLCPEKVNPQICKDWFNLLLNHINWHKTLTHAFTGEPTDIPRKMAYISDKGEDYAYANMVLSGSTWAANPFLVIIKKEVEIISEHEFNSVLLNLYENGNDKISWHSDKEAQLGENPVIVSFNLGSSRTFHFRTLDKTIKDSVVLNNGDVLVMDCDCQKNWQHAILPEMHVKEPRISLTFRKTI